MSLSVVLRQPGGYFTIAIFTTSTMTIGVHDNAVQFKVANLQHLTFFNEGKSMCRAF
jgi:hypothetical protein